MNAKYTDKNYSPKRFKNDSPTPNSNTENTSMIFHKSTKLDANRKECSQVSERPPDIPYRFFRGKNEPDLEPARIKGPAEM